MEDVAFAFTKQEEADGALGAEGISLWNHARSGRFDSLLAKAALVRASCDLSKAQANQRTVAAYAWHRRKLAQMAETVRRSGALRRPVVSADSDRTRAREAAIAAVQLALSWNHPGGLSQELQGVSSERRAKVIEQGLLLSDCILVGGRSFHVEWSIARRGVATVCVAGLYADMVFTLCGAVSSAVLATVQLPRRGQCRHVWRVAPCAAKQRSCRSRGAVFGTSWP